jgi:[ribosomal protein S18]-alanine N-acetyltransferase
MICAAMTLADVPQVAVIDAATNTSAWPAAEFAQQLKLSHAHSLVVYDSAILPHRHIVGFCVYWLVADEMQLLAIATAPLQQRRGIATLLMTTACRDARQQGATQVTLEVRSSNHAALALYQSWGFLGQGSRKAYYQNGDDAIIMQATIPATVEPATRSSQ